MWVLIATDSRLYREGLTALLAGIEGIERVDTADNHQRAVQLVSAGPPYVVLLDMAMPDSFDVLRAISESAFGSKIIAIGVTEDDDQVIACAEAGAAGYLSREGSLDQLAETIQSVARGEALCSPRIVGTLFRRIATLASERDIEKLRVRLSPREREIAVFLDQGLSNKEIARRLSIEVPTVKNHVHNILEKLHVHRRGEAAAKLRHLVSISQSPHATPAS